MHGCCRRCTLPCVLAIIAGRRRTWKAGTAGRPLPKPMLKPLKPLMDSEECGQLAIGYIPTVGTEVAASAGHFGCRKDHVPCLRTCLMGNRHLAWAEDYQMLPNNPNGGVYFGRNPNSGGFCLCKSRFTSVPEFKTLIERLPSILPDFPTVSERSVFWKTHSSQNHLCLQIPSVHSFLFSRNTRYRIPPTPPPLLSRVPFRRVKYIYIYIYRAFATYTFPPSPFPLPHLP